MRCYLIVHREIYGESPDRRNGRVKRRRLRPRFDNSYENPLFHTVRWSNRL